MVKTRTKEITIKESKGAFSIFYPSKKPPRENYNFQDLSQLRHLLNKEKARLIDKIKTDSPGSVYELAKKLKRPFKAVMDDVKFLEKYGIITLKKEIVKNRKRHKPIVEIDKFTIHLQI